MPNRIAKTFLCLMGPLTAICGSASAQTSGTSAWARSGANDSGSYDPSPAFHDDGSRIISPTERATAQSSFNIDPIDASASAYADLTTGKMGVFGSSNYAFYGGQAAATRSEASILDRVTFSIAGATPDQITPITVKFGLDGIFSGRPGGYGLGTISANLALGSGTGVLITNNEYFSPQSTGYQVAASGWQSYSYASDANGIMFTGIYNLQGASSIIDIMANLRGKTYGEATTDFSHTSAVDFILPTNVTFTSVSNKFLTNVAPVSGVPEPATWAMMIVGFGMVGGSMRYRHRSAKVAFA